MSKKIEVNVPDIGDFKDVDVIEVLVAAGDEIEAEASLVTLESDKATMEIPSPQGGKVVEVLVGVGDKVSKGSPLLRLEVDEAGDQPAGGEGAVPEAASEAAVAQPPTRSPEAEAPAPQAAEHSGEIDKRTEVLVLGAGPGGYTAAFRAADLGKQVTLIERYPDLGGVCLNVGCIPSKALLHTAEVINEVAELERMGVRYTSPRIDLEKMRAGKDKTVKRMTGGLAGLAKQRKVEVVQGTGRFVSPNRIEVHNPEGQIVIEFEHCIVACGSSPVQIPGFPSEDPRLMDSTDALELADIPERMLIIGGGIIGLEMATVYATLGSRLDIVELQDGLIPGCDRDLVKPLEKRLKAQVDNIYLGTKVTQIKAAKKGLTAYFEGGKAPESELYDRILVAVGRRPNGGLIDADKAGVKVDKRGFVPVDGHMRTNVPHIYAIGDVVGDPMLAHKATHEGKVAAEVIAGLPALFDPLTIPSVAYTDPEVAWMGLTETEAKRQGTEYEKGVFPWAASGRAVGIGRDEGMTKLLFDPETRRILGAGIVGRNAGELIGETVLALEMGADAEDIGLTIHPHPTLNETVCFAAEMAEGTITDLMPPKKRK